VKEKGWVECGFRVTSLKLVGWRVKREKKKKIDGNGGDVIMAGMAFP
jgi:hypothetical protein